MSDTKLLQEYTAVWEKQAGGVRASAAIREIQEHAARRFADMEWPDTQIEEWRRTSVSNYDFGRYQVAGAGDGGGAAVPTVRVPEGGCAGVRARTLQEVVGKAEGGDAGAARVLENITALMKERIDAADNRFILWPWVVLQDVHIIEADNSSAQEGGDAAGPIVIDCPVTGDGAVQFPLVIITVAESSRASVVIRLRSAGDGEQLCVSDMLCRVGDAGKLDVSVVSAFNDDSIHMGNGCIWLGRDAVARHGVVTLGSLLEKQRIDAYLDGQGAEAYLDGCYVGNMDRHIDMRTLQVHRAPSTNSFALYRGVATDEAHIIYQGLIEVQEEALVTDAYLTNNNLILSDEARSDSIPSLNIKTDEVKCSHGSTTGKIDSNELFYLQSRGLTRDEATKMIVHGFLGEVVDRLPGMLHDELHTAFDQLLLQQPGSDSL